MKTTSEIHHELIELTRQFLKESGEIHHREVKMNTSLQSLGIDSLGRAELFQRIEKLFKVQFPDRLLAEAENLEDIANYLLTDPQLLIKNQKNQVMHTHTERTTVDPSQAQSLTDILFLYAQNAPQKPHIYFQHEDGSEEIITYGKLLESSLHVAQGLRDLGLKNNETVAIMLPTMPAFFYVFFGTLLAGGIPVPIYPPFKAHMIEAYAKTEAGILANAEVRLLVTFDQAEKLSLLLKSFVPSLKHVTTVDSLVPSFETRAQHAFQDERKAFTPFHASADNFAFIQYTSGSTSAPKGVLLTHANLLANIRAYGEAVKVVPEDVAVSWLPLYHDMGLIGMWLGSLYFGVPLILLTPFTFLNHPERWLWAIHYHRGTLSGAPNFAYDLCVRKIDPSLIEGLDLSSWRMAANGAEKIYPQTLEQFTKKFAAHGFKHEAMLPVYGLAESTVGLAISPLDRGFRIDRVERKAFEEERRAIPTSDKDQLSFVACGKAIVDHEIRIVDDQGQVLAERMIGNLQFRGPSSMQGYFNNPAATQAIYHDGGWLESGDLAYLADGEVFITGRRKDLIIKAGRNIYPVEIEEIVGQVNGVRQGCVAAFSVNEEQRVTEKLVVVAETRETDKTIREEISANINQAIGAALDLTADQVILVEPHTVPKTSSGKLQRAACKKLYLTGRLTRHHTPTWLQVTKLGLRALGIKSVQAVKTLFASVYTLYVLLLVLISFIPLFAAIVFSSQKTAAKIAKWWARIILFAAVCPLRINSPRTEKQNKPVIYVANHASYVDAIVLTAVLPAGVRYVAKKELFMTPILRTLMRKLNYLPVDRMDLSKRLTDTKIFSQTLREGHSLVIFPEGTFGYAAGLRPFRLGAFKVAAEEGLAIVPVALQGTRSVLRDDERLMHHGCINVTIMDPVQANGTEWQDVTQLRNEVRAKIAMHCGEPSLDFIAAQVVAPKR